MKEVGLVSFLIVADSPSLVDDRPVMFDTVVICPPCQGLGVVGTLVDRLSLLALNHGLPPTVKRLEPELTCELNRFVAELGKGLA